MISSYTPYKSKRKCPFCSRTRDSSSFKMLMIRRLSINYCTSQNFFYAREINDILFHRISIYKIRYQEMRYIDKDNDNFKRFYNFHDSRKALKQLFSTYYQETDFTPYNYDDIYHKTIKKREFKLKILIEHYKAKRKQAQTEKPPEMQGKIFLDPLLLKELDLLQKLKINTSSESNEDLVQALKLLTDNNLTKKYDNKKQKSIFKEPSSLFLQDSIDSFLSPKPTIDFEMISSNYLDRNKAKLNLGIPTTINTININNNYFVGSLYPSHKKKIIQKNFKIHSKSPSVRDNSQNRIGDTNGFLTERNAKAKTNFNINSNTTANHKKSESPSSNFYLRRGSNNLKYEEYLYFDGFGRGNGNVQKKKSLSKDFLIKSKSKIMQGRGEEKEESNFGNFGKIYTSIKIEGINSTSQTNNNKYKTTTRQGRTTFTSK